MNRSTDVDMLLSEWLREAPPSSPVVVHEEAMRRVRLARQRPAWLAALYAGARRASLPALGGIDRYAAPAGLALLILAILLLAIVAIVGSAPRPAPPFGVVRNGTIAFDADRGLFEVDGRWTVSARARPESNEEMSPSYSPDGRHLAYWAGAEDGSSTLVIADSDGDSAERYPFIGRMRIATGRPPAWAPDGTSVAFTGLSHTFARVFIARADGSSVDAVIGDDIGASTPAWSPDGSWIAFIGVPSSGDRAAGVYVTRPDGTGMRRLPTSPLPRSSLEGEQLAWAPVPGQQRLLYHVGPDGAYDIGIFDVATDRETIVSSDAANEFWASWSPDGSRVAWYARGPATDEIRVADVTSSGQAGTPRSILVEPPLTPSDDVTCPGDRSRAGVFVCSPPVWSPDGRSLAAFDVLGTTILVFSADGDEASARHVAIPSGVGGSLAWQRIP